MGINERLARRRSPIKVGLVGAGYMGCGVLNIISGMRTMEVVGLFDHDLAACGEAREKYGSRNTQLFAVLEDLCATSGVEVIVDGTPDPVLGAEVAQFCLKHSKHLVSINIECDATIGAIVRQLFDEKKLVYTVTAGDEPGELKVLYDHYKALNFRVVALGKGKNNLLQVEATPGTVRGSLPENGITAEQVASFVDGSKTMFEMGCLSNATGLVPDCPGMHGPEARIQEIVELFRTKEKGGILDREGVVDYVTGSELAGGVFAVVATNNERIGSDFQYLKIGTGPYYLFYQRYHNWFIDTPLSVARAVLENEATVASLPTPTSEVVAVAKRDLKAGEILDGIGGYYAYGKLEERSEAILASHLPHGLTPGAHMQRDVRKGEILTYDDVVLDEELALVKLRKKQEEREKVSKDESG